MSERKYLHVGVELYCPHCGKVHVKPVRRRSLVLGDTPVRTAEDVEGADIVGCQLKPPFKKCTKVVRIVLGKVADVKVDGQTPLLHDLLFLTDSTPPGFGFAAGMADGVVTHADASCPASAPATKEPATKVMAKKSGVRVVRVRLNRESLPAEPPGWWIPFVHVTAGQVRPKEVWQHAMPQRMPLDGSEVRFELDVEPGAECWVVVTTWPFINAVDTLEAVGRRPRRVVDPDEAFALEPEARAEAVATYAELARLDNLSPAPPNWLLGRLNEMIPDTSRKPVPPAGGVVRAPVRLGPGVEVVEVEPAYPALLALSWALADLDKALEEPRTHKRQGLHERLALARFCANLEGGSPWGKFDDAFASTSGSRMGQSWPDPPTNGSLDPPPEPPERIYVGLLQTHEWKRTRWAGPLHKQLRRVRDQLAAGPMQFADVRRDYVLYTTRSPRFLGTCDLDRPGLHADTLLPAYLSHTAANPAVQLLRRTLRLLDEGVHLLMLLHVLEIDAPTDPTPAEFEAWQDFFASAEETWGFGGEPTPPAAGGGAVAGPTPLRSLSGWKLLSKVLESMVKHTAKEVGKNRAIASWVDEQGRLTLSWLVSRERDARSAKRVIELLGEKGKPYKPAQLVNGGQKKGKSSKRSQQKGKSSKARMRQANKDQVSAAAGKRLRLLRRLYPVVAAMMLIEQTRAALARKWRTDDPIGFGIDLARTTLSGVKLTQAGLEAYVEFKWAATLVRKGKATGTARQALEKLTRPGGWAKALGKVATWGEAILGASEVIRDHARGDHVRANVRTAGVGIALGAALWGATLAAGPALLVALGAVAVGVLIDTLVSEMELTEEERGLRDLLRETEFGKGGYPSRREVAELYDHPPPAATTVPPRLTKYLAALPWRVLLALIPTRVGAKPDHALGVAVWHRPSPLLCPVSYVRVETFDGPFLLGVEATPDKEGNSLVRLTLAREAHKEMALEKIRAREGVRPEDGAPDSRHLPYHFSGSSLVMFPPAGLYEWPVVVKDIFLPPGWDFVVIFGPNPLAPPPYGATPWPVLEAGREGDSSVPWPSLRVEVLQRAPDLRVVAAKEPVPGKRARLEFPVGPEASVVVHEEDD